MHPDFAVWLSGRPRGIGKAPVFPELAGKLIAGRRGLSVQFRDIAKKAGIVGRVVTREGKGRATNSKTFHALRHSFVSALANAGVASEIRQKLAGHSDSKVHANYTHHELQTLRGAIAKLPSLKALWKRSERRNVSGKQKRRRSNAKAEEGSAERNVFARSFHSLRHSFVTALDRANVAVELRQKLAGHVSEQQSLHLHAPRIRGSSRGRREAARNEKPHNHLKAVRKKFYPKASSKPFAIWRAIRRLGFAFCVSLPLAQFIPTSTDFLVRHRLELHGLEPPSQFVTMLVNFLLSVSFGSHPVADLVHLPFDFAPLWPRGGLVPSLGSTPRDVQGNKVSKVDKGEVVGYKIH
jgi:Phage integrase family